MNNLSEMLDPTAAILKCGPPEDGNQKELKLFLNAVDIASQLLPVLLRELLELRADAYFDTPGADALLFKIRNLTGYNGRFPITHPHDNDPMDEEEETYMRHEIAMLKEIKSLSRKEILDRISRYWNLNELKENLSLMKIQPGTQEELDILKRFAAMKKLWEPLQSHSPLSRIRTS